MPSVLKVDEIQNPSTNVTVINTKTSHEIDCWKVDTSVSNTNLTYTAWSRNNDTFNDGTPIGKFPIGTGLTESSGIFSFPATGVYQIDLTILYSTNKNNANPQWRFQVSKDNGSNYTNYGVVRATSSKDVAQGLNLQAMRKTASATFFVDVNSVTGSNATKFRIFASGIPAANVVNMINQNVASVQANYSNLLCQRIGNSPVAS